MFRLIVYPQSIHQLNLDSFLYVHPDLFKESNWIDFVSQNSNRSFKIIRSMLCEMTIITKLAYTYHMTGIETYEISPYYFESLYQSKSLKEFYEDKTSSMIFINVLRRSKFMKDYLVIDSFGRTSLNNNIISYVCTKYTVTDKLKELASKFSESQSLFSIDINVFDDDLLQHKKAYIVGSKEFDTLLKARAFCKSNNVSIEKISSKTAIDKIFSNCSYQTSEEINKKSCKITEEEYPFSIDLHHTVKLNRKALVDMINDINLYATYGNSIATEIIKMYERTTDDNPFYDLNYHKTTSGRYYCMCSPIQMFPRKLRESILSEYAEVDMKSSVFSLYYNLANKFKYTGNLKQITDIIVDPKKYRMKFVNESISYDDAKTVLTAIAYGAKGDVYNMFMQMYEPSMAFHKSCLLNISVDQSRVFEMVSTSEIQDLIKEIRQLGNFLFKKMNCDNAIINAYGNPLQLSKRPSFGAKLAHIMQSYESKILMELSKYKIDGYEIRHIPNGIGLYLHDGIYINKELIKNTDICLEFHNLVDRELGFDVNYVID